MTDAELEKARTQIEAEVIFDRDSTDQIAASLSEAIAVADWEWYADYPARCGGSPPRTSSGSPRSTFVDDGLTVRSRTFPAGSRAGRDGEDAAEVQR